MTKSTAKSPTASGPRSAALQAIGPVMTLLSAALLPWAAPGVAGTVPARAATPTAFPVAGGGLRMSLLPPSERRYLRYTIKDGARTAIDIWTRKVAFESRDGLVQLHMTQRWDQTVPAGTAILQDSWFDARTFRPLTHQATVIKGGVPTVSAYRFGPTGIVGDEAVVGNVRAGFRLDYPEPAYNFEYDIELLQTIPWRLGLAADLVFYDPGKSPPAHYVFRATGEVRVTGPDGRATDCWIVSTDYNRTGAKPTRFWLTKAGHVMVHQEAEFEGATYVKTLLGEESGKAP